MTDFSRSAVAQATVYSEVGTYLHLIEKHANSSDWEGAMQAAWWLMGVLHQAKLRAAPSTSPSESQIEQDYLDRRGGR